MRSHVCRTRRRVCGRNHQPPTRVPTLAPMCGGCQKRWAGRGYYLRDPWFGPIRLSVRFAARARGLKPTIFLVLRFFCNQCICHVCTRFWASTMCRIHSPLELRFLSEAYVMHAPKMTPASVRLLLCTLLHLAAKVIHATSTFDKQCAILMEEQLGEYDGHYSKVIEPTLSPSHLQDLPGFTRSFYKRDHALITPESQVFSALPGWQKTTAAYLISPAMGSHFSMYLAKMEADSLSGLPAIGIERFIFVLNGDLILSTSSEGSQKLSVDSFVYLPPNVTHTLQCNSFATVVIYEKRYHKVGNGDLQLIVGKTNTQPVLETPGEVFVLRKLLPTSEVFDFNIHVMDFEPGDFLNVKEVHYNQHGLLMLEGRGIYRLGDHWYPVQAGDAIWMAPFVPQWYGALGRTRTRYLLYKDVNRDPLLNFS